MAANRSGSRLLSSINLQPREIVPRRKILQDRLDHLEISGSSTVQRSAGVVHVIRHVQGSKPRSVSDVRRHMFSIVWDRRLAPRALKRLGREHFHT